MKKFIVMIVLLLVACTNTVEDLPVEDKDLQKLDEVFYTDVEGRTYETVEIGDLFWINEDLHLESIGGYQVEGAILYDREMLKKIEDGLTDGWRLPTKEEWLILIEDQTLEELTQGSLKLNLAGMYDFTGIYQWQNQGCLYVGRDIELVYFFSDGSSESLKVGKFHPKDGFSIRLVKER